MAMGENGDHQFRLDVSQKILDEMIELMKQAEEAGIGTRFRQSLQQILRRLMQEPQEFGELVRVLSHMDLQVHVGSVYPLTVRFAFNNTNRLVYIMKLFLADHT